MVYHKGMCPVLGIIRYQTSRPCGKKTSGQTQKLTPLQSGRCSGRSLIAGHVKTVIFPARAALYHVVKVKEFKAAKQVQDRSYK